MQNPYQARPSDSSDSADSVESADSVDSVDSGESVESGVFVDFAVFDDFDDFSISAQQQHHQSPRSGASTSTSCNRHVPVQYLQHAPRSR